MKYLKKINKLVLTAYGFIVFVSLILFGQFLIEVFRERDIDPLYGLLITGLIIFASAMFGWKKVF